MLSTLILCEEGADGADLIVFYAGRIEHYRYADTAMAETVLACLLADSPIG